MESPQISTLYRYQLKFLKSNHYQKDQRLLNAAIFIYIRNIWIWAPPNRNQTQLLPLFLQFARNNPLWDRTCSLKILRKILRKISRKIACWWKTLWMNTLNLNKKNFFFLTKVNIWKFSIIMLMNFSPEFLITVI